MKRFSIFAVFAPLLVLAALGGLTPFHAADPLSLTTTQDGSLAHSASLGASIDPGACFRWQRAGTDDTASALPSALRRGLVHAAFNRPARAESTLVRYLEQAGASADTADLVRAREALAENYVRMGRYRAAARAYDVLLRDFRGAADSARVADWTNAGEIWAALRDAPPQDVQRAGDSQIPLARDKAGLTTLPVELSGTERPFVLDTGAGLSVIGDSLADRLGFRIVAESVPVGSTTGEVRAQLALAPPIRFGRVAVRNAVFLVLPDDNLSFPQIDYRIHGIVGLPILTALREITWQKDVLHVPERPRSSTVHGAPNLCFAGDRLLMRATFEGVPVTFQLDSGANSSDLFSSFYEAHERLLRERGVPDSVQVGGAAGIQVYRIVRVDDASLHLAGQEVRVPSVAVYTESGERAGDRHADGTLGQDAIRQFEAVTLNFDAMHLHARGPGEAGESR